MHKRLSPIRRRQKEDRVTKKEVTKRVILLQIDHLPEPHRKGQFEVEPMDWKTGKNRIKSEEGNGCLINGISDPELNEDFENIVKRPGLKTNIPYLIKDGDEFIVIYRDYGEWDRVDDHDSSTYVISLSLFKWKDRKSTEG